MGVDIGCGTGGNIATLSLDYSCVGIDASKEAIRLASARFPNVRFMQGSVLEHLNEFSAQAKFFLLMDVLEHVEEPEKLIQEASRVLKKGGLFFFHTFNRNFWSWLMVIKGVEWCVPNTPTHMHVYSLFIKPSELQRMSLRHGLHTEEIKGLNPDLRSQHFWKMIFFGEVFRSFHQ